MDYFLFLTRHTVNCRRQAEIKAKSTVQTPFFEKSAEMQLLNSDILRRAQTTKYSNKKTQDLLNLVLFMFCSFFVLQRWRRNGDLNPRYAYDVYTISNRAPSTTQPFLHSRYVRISYSQSTILLYIIGKNLSNVFSGFNKIYFFAENINAHRKIKP